MHWHGPTAVGTRASLIEGDIYHNLVQHILIGVEFLNSKPNKTAKKPASLCATVNDAEPVEQLLILLVFFNISLLEQIYNLFESCASRLTVVWAKNHNKF